MATSERGTVIVTGGSRGIGAAAVAALCAAGRPVAFSYLSSDAAADRLCGQVGAAGGRVLAVRADVAEAEGVELLFRRCTEAFGPPTGVFANAGITGPATRLGEVATGDLRRVIEVNLLGALLTARAAVRAMSTARGGGGGAIVLMSSRAAKLGGAGEWVHYAATKGAIDSMAVGLAREVGAEGIRVNAVAPGLIDTEIHAAAGLADRLERKAGEVPLGRIGAPAEVAQAVVWLLSDAASYVSGTVVDVSGGR
jgi:glucose 1-dehydrogenase